MNLAEVTLKVYVPLVLVLIGCRPNSIVVSSAKKKTTTKKSSKCEVCKDLVDTFAKGIEATSKVKHYGGGDTAWEESKLGSYENSELRLVEITDESLCHIDDSAKQRKCHQFAEQHEDLIENWWFNHKAGNSDLFPWLCIEQVKVCCPNNTFGPECEACKVIRNDVVCGGHGKCDGSGSREGTGACVCDPGYQGDSCDSCALGYFPVTDDDATGAGDDNATTCQQCDVSCDTTQGCHSAGPAGCVSCGAGFERDEEYGCEDVDECTDGDAGCQSNQFCLNNKGSYSCLDCAPECASCSGAGAENCEQCAPDHIIVDGKCTAQSSTTPDQLPNADDDDITGSENSLPGREDITTGSDDAVTGSDDTVTGSEDTLTGSDYRDTLGNNDGTLDSHHHDEMEL